MLAQERPKTPRRRPGKGVVGSRKLVTVLARCCRTALFVMPSLVSCAVATARAPDLDDRLAAAVMEAARGDPATARVLVANILAQSPKEPRALLLLACVEL